MAPHLKQEGVGLTHVLSGFVNNGVCPTGNLQLLSVDVHLEQGVSKGVSKAAGVEVAVRSAIALLVVDLRELQAAILQQLIVVELLVRQVNLLVEGGGASLGF